MYDVRAGISSGLGADNRASEISSIFDVTDNERRGEIRHLLPSPWARRADRGQINIKRFARESVDYGITACFRRPPVGSRVGRRERNAAVLVDAVWNVNRVVGRRPDRFVVPVPRAPFRSIRLRHNIRRYPCGTRVILPTGRNNNALIVPSVLSSFHQLASFVTVVYSQITTSVLNKTQFHAYGFRYKLTSYY